MRGLLADLAATAARVCAARTLLACIALSVWCGAGALAQTLSLVTGASPPLAPDGDKPGFTELVAREAFARLGVPVTVMRLPAERALVNVDQGLDDGDLSRVAGMEATYPNLLRVPESIVVLEFVGFTRSLDFPVTGWEVLRPHVVGIVTGLKIFEDNVRDVRERIAVKDSVQLFQLLQSGRADVVMLDRWQGLWSAKQAGIRPHTLEPPFARRELYPYLHKQHAALVPRLAAAIAAVKADGTYARLEERALKPLLIP